MITAEFVSTMARYNAWQNTSIYAAASSLTDDNRNAGAGAFFKPIHATLNHILWAGQGVAVAFQSDSTST